MSEQQKHTAGAFDVRNVIAALIGAYGVVLVLMGLFHDTAEESERTGGLAANLWAGIAMVAFAAAFALWARLRPVVVDPPSEPTDGEG
ncbi:hypothetical protein TEK04_13795 [Klenkia sp. LSe6-5]|uniref:Uncharacterized protein n=1 Tax=Klenkia sesuvii TaxID=3103137 RepID=A0ABU8DVI6_9ACTN